MEFNNEVPGKNKAYWQFEFIPFLRIFHVYPPKENDEESCYTASTALTIGWLFWNLTFTFEGKKHK